MKFFLYGLLFTIFIQITVNAQSDSYEVKILPFCSNEYDEFAPVFYQNGIVFCSNQKSRMLLNYSTTENKGTVKIVYIDSSAIINGHHPELFSRELTTNLNDGPVTFSADGKLIYFSRNLNAGSKLGDITDVRNKLGLFEAEFSDGKWSKIREFRFNNEVYNITTPCLSPDGTQLYFASDMTGGYGGFDLYYSQWKNDYWDKPVNLGPVINTSKNELYPFIRVSGEMYFTSDGHGGLGGKDIFYSKMDSGEWLPPVPLDSPINSKYDDFAFIINQQMKGGFFSSSRAHSVDIYEFNCILPQIFYCNAQKENRYCFQFKDDNETKIDNILLQFEWNFGDGSSTAGYTVEHCYSGPGKYTLRENIVEKKTGKVVFNKFSVNIEIDKIQQPYITCEDNVLLNTPVNFEANDSYLPGYKILSYTWDIGDGTKTSGMTANHEFKEAGKKLIRLAISAKDMQSGAIREFCVSKEITVAVSANELTSLKEAGSRKKDQWVDLTDYQYASHDTTYSIKREMARDAVFQVALLFAPEKINLNQGIFKNISARYTLKQEFLPEENQFACIIDEGRNLMDVYNSYSDAISLGFKDSRVITFIHNDPAEKELETLKRVYGLSADNFFLPDESRLSQNAYPLLDQLVAFMKKYPDIILVVSSFTDNSGTLNMNISLSQNRSQNMVNYMIGRGISKSRLISRGFGSSRPITFNYSEEERKHNRRVDFTIINK